MSKPAPEQPVKCKHCGEEILIVNETIHEEPTMWLSKQHYTAYCSGGVHEPEEPAPEQEEQKCNICGGCGVIKNPNGSWIDVPCQCIRPLAPEQEGNHIVSFNKKVCKHCGESITQQDSGLLRMRDSGFWCDGQSITCSDGKHHHEPAPEQKQITPEQKSIKALEDRMEVLEKMVIDLHNEHSSF